ncbi:MAG: glycosyltransferase [Chitinophagia bacterium]|nr:glycosyltransferase [Chitinophagia bacterium]
MRLAFLSICGMPWGGSEELWSSTALEALSQGHEVLVSVYGWPEMPTRIRELQDKGARVILRRRYYPGPGRRLRKKLWNTFLPRGRKTTYHDYLEDFKPQHILFSLAGGNEIASDPGDMMLFVRQTRIPFSVMYHSLTKGYTYPDDLAENMRSVISKAAHSFFTSQYQADLYRSQLRHLIGNAVVLDHAVRRIDAAPLPEMTGPVRMCLIGSLVQRWKGQDIAIAALSSPRWLERQWTLDIYGTGEDRDRLVEQVLKASLSDRVSFRGYGEDIEGILATHHLVLIPSRQDSGPIVLFEAMQAARPVVGTPMGAMPDRIQEGVNGFLSPTICDKGFAAALEKAWDAQERWHEIGCRARKDILARLDPYPQKTLLKLISG